jgi:hypothetical protein
MAAMGAVSLYAVWRMTRRPAVAVEETAHYTPLAPTATPVAVDVAAEVAAEQILAAEEEREAAPQPSAVPASAALRDPAPEPPAPVG